MTRPNEGAKRRVLVVEDDSSIALGLRINLESEGYEVLSAEDGEVGLTMARENEPFEIALRRFKRTCEKAGVLAETRKREFYEKPTQERKRKRAAAVKRHLRRLSRDVSRKTRLY